jgi:hypothetical protein
VFDFDKPGSGFFYEANALASAIQAGRKESAIMPWSETIRVLDIMDGIRHENRAFFHKMKSR